MALSRYLTNLAHKCTDEFNAYACEIADMENATEQICWRILEKVNELDNRFHTARVLKTGSFYEGTKISKPDEFDMMAVNDELSSPGICQAVQECPNAAGFAHVLLKDETVVDRWRELTYSRKDGRTYILPYNQFGSVQERFGKLVKQAYEHLCSQQHRRVCKPTGTLEMERQSPNATRPGCQFNVKWKPSRTDNDWEQQQIKIDLTVAIDVEVANEHESDNKRFLLVPAWCYECQDHPNITLCWRRSFSLNEKQAFEEMGCSHIHKRCNRVLKYLRDMLDLDRNPFQVSSYVIKTLVLRHEQQYAKMEHKRLDKCVMRCLHDLVDCCREKKLQSFHVPNCNIFAGVGIRKLIATEKAIHLVIAALKQVNEKRRGNLLKRLRYDMKNFLNELRKDSTSKVKHCLVNADCQKWFLWRGERSREGLRGSMRNAVAIRAHKTGGQKPLTFE